MAGYEIETLVCGPLQNNVYVLFALEGKTALAIDPGLESASRIGAVLKERGATLSTVVTTHYHFDHMAEAGEVAQAHGAPILAHGLDADRVSHPAPPTMFPDLVVPPAPVTRELAAGDTVRIGEVELTVLHTPGHTPGSMCLYSAAMGDLFAGDTLFKGSFGRYDLPGGDAAKLRASLLELAKLPGGTHVFPGHGPVTTIGGERWLSNPPL